MTATAEKTKHINLYSLAADALDEKNGDVQKAVNYLRLRLNKDRALLEIVLEEAVQFALSEKPRAASKATRYNLVASVERAANRGSVVALSRGIAASLLDFRLPGGKKIKDANRSEIEADAEFYGRQASDMGHKARWLRLIAQSIPDGKLGGDVISAERALELWEETKCTV